MPVNRSTIQPATGVKTPSSKPNSSAGRLLDAWRRLSGERRRHTHEELVGWYTPEYGWTMQTKSRFAGSISDVQQEPQMAPRGRRSGSAGTQRKGPFVRRVLTRQHVHTWIHRLAKLPAEQRSRLRGVSVPRARQILAGAVVADLTMTTLDIDSVEVCPWALREGIVLRHLESMVYTSPFSLRPMHRPRPTHSNRHPADPRASGPAGRHQACPAARAGAQRWSPSPDPD